MKKKNYMMTKYKSQLLLLIQFQKVLSPSAHNKNQLLCRNPKLNDKVRKEFVFVIIIII